MSRLSNVKNKFISNRKTSLKIISRFVILITVPIVISVIIVKLFPSKAFSIKTSEARSYLETFGVWAPLGYITFQIATIPLVPVPSVILATVGGLLFGFGRGVFYTSIAWFIGNSINYWVARILGRPFLKKMLEERELLIIDKFANNLNWRAIFLSWFIPGGTADVVGYASGLMKIPYKRYVSAILPALILFSIFTSAAGAAIPISPIPSIIFIVGAMLGIVFFPVLYRAFCKRIMVKRYGSN